MELRIQEAVWRFESVYASIFDRLAVHSSLELVLARVCIGHRLIQGIAVSFHLL